MFGARIKVKTLSTLPFFWMIIVHRSTEHMQSNMIQKFMRSCMIHHIQQYNLLNTIVFIGLTTLTGSRHNLVFTVLEREPVTRSCIPKQAVVRVIVCANQGIVIVT